MKKVPFLLLAIAAFVMSCDDTNENELPQQDVSTAQEIDMSDFYLTTDEDELSRSASSKNSSKNCSSMEVLNRQLKENPGLYKKMYNAELHTRNHTAKGKPTGGGGPNGGGGDTDVDVTIVDDNLGVINIPVYIHIVYPDGTDTNGSVKDSQITSQMAVLDADFRNTNTEPLPDGTTFENDRTDAGFEFSLAGIFRHDDPTSSWGTNNSVKAEYPPITPKTHMNIWVCNIGGGILGYAQFPAGNELTDGIVLGGEYFGNTGGVYGAGRTATHEVGHYLNLRHIWGDGRCNRDDFVADTPTAGSSNGGCPDFPSVSCKSTDMTMNYMDYVYDNCMYMFTDGQRNRMRAIFASGGSRSTMVN